MISAIVNTCNEEKYLERCLEHLKWVDEIVIIDMYSTDKSVEIARRYTDKIYFHPRTISVLYARNFSLTKASGDWILIVDPDEVIPFELAEKLREISSSNPDFNAVAFPQRIIFLGKELKYAYPVIWKTRFFKKGTVYFPPRVHSHPVVEGEIYSLAMEERYTSTHYVAQNLFEFVEKMNRYTSDEALHMHKDDNIKFKIFDLICKPISEFIHRYILRQGYRDGREGFIFSYLMAIYRFLTYAKLWEIENVK